MSERMRGSRWRAALALCGVAGACATAPARDAEPVDTGGRSARVAVAAAVAEAEAAAAAGRKGDAARALGRVWGRTAGLEDDRVVRGAVAALGLEGREVPPALAAVVKVEEAQAALATDTLGRARRAAEEALGVRGADALTSLRARVLLGLAARREAPEIALGHLLVAANEAEGAPARSVVEAGALARMAAAGLLRDRGDLKGAIAAFLRVAPTSGRWRTARLGLATCQLEAGRPEAALKILALLPGGLVAEPERALLAAMAAHGLGLAEEARAIVDAALADRAAWQAATATEDAVLAEAERLERGGGQPERDTLITVVAAEPAVRAAVAEVLATRAERAGDGAAEAGALAGWEDRVSREARAVVAREVAAAATRAETRFADLEALAPQLR